MCNQLGCCWLPSPDRHLDCVGDEFGTDVVGDQPANHPPRVSVDHDRAVDLAGVGWVFGDVHDPQPVRYRRVERTVDQIIRDR
ncbi:MAG: hypothetical protein ACI8Y4_004057 [Candidatus Poriferisodalaceae bacterium]|jgi:hypothetical protein